MFKPLLADVGMVMSAVVIAITVMAMVAHAKGRFLTEEGTGI